MSLQHNMDNMSYTNKDFNSIYTELLEYAKKLSYKWDPTASDESDPGVVLLKLNALIGDKNNYNIDKNVLELLPASVSQLPAARQLFDQCGYSMKHYQAAEGELSLTVKSHPTDVVTDGEPKDYYYKLPRFTMFSDVDKTVVYTSVVDAELQYKQSTSVTVLEGIATKYTINNDENITLRNLDSKNRLYLTDYNVAENGIFISNINANDYDEWYRVDNIEVQPLGSKCFKFGITLNTNRCYIEFPDDVDLLFGEGVNIYYIRTSGTTGNIAAKRITEFYTDTTLPVYQAKATDSKDVDVTTDNIVITNALPITNGQDPESIDSAYKSYKRVKDTFDTLVTLNDYTDYMISSKQASNGFVCDRTNDVQHSYKILETNDYANVIHNHIENDALNAFNLTVYALEYKSSVNTQEDFDATFILTDTEGTTIPAAFYDSKLKSIQHDFKPLESNKILYIKNKYTIRAHVIPKYKISIKESYEIKDSIYAALYSALNSKELVFGEAVAYDKIYDTLNTADDRIKAVSVVYPTYETYAVYLDSNKTVNELRIDNQSIAPTDDTAELWQAFRTEIYAKNILAGVTPLYTYDTTFSYGLNQQSSATYSDITSLKTNLNISLKQDKNNDKLYICDTLKENENIVLSRPNTVEQTSYSSYVKYLYSFSKPIAASSEYKLTDDDYIVFFWKSVQTNTAYDYVKYTASDGIKISPTFNIGTETDDTTTNDTRITNDSNGIGNKVSTKGLTSDEITDSITKLVDGEYVLTGVQAIKILKENSITINENSDQGCNLIYWITDTLDASGKCVLFSDTATEYTLKSGEYFFYLNPDRTNLHILGEGTRLTRGTKLELSDEGVDKLKYSELAEKGISAIKDWVVIDTATANNNKQLTATEMKLIQLGKDVTLKITFQNPLTIKDNEGKEILVTSTSIDSDGGTLQNVTAMSYIDSTNTETTIPVGDGTWSITPLLNLNMSNTVPQQLEGNQSIIINNGTPLTNCYVLASQTLNTVGGTIPLTNYSDLQLMTYEPISTTESSDTRVSYTSDKFVVSVSGTGTTEAVKLPKGEYLIHLTTDFSVTALSLALIADSTAGNLTPFTASAAINRVYTLNVTDDSKELKFTVTSAVQDENKTATVYIQPLLKIDSESDTRFEGESDFFGSIKTRLNDLDSDGKFDYTHITNDMIYDPLDPESFHNKDHFYNRFTIDQWHEKSENDIVVTTNIR